MLKVITPNELSVDCYFLNDKAMWKFDSKKKFQNTHRHYSCTNDRMF